MTADNESRLIRYTEDASSGLAKIVCSRSTCRRASLSVFQFKVTSRQRNGSAVASAVACKDLRVVDIDKISGNARYSITSTQQSCVRRKRGRFAIAEYCSFMTAAGELGACNKNMLYRRQFMCAGDVSSCQAASFASYKNKPSHHERLLVL